MSLFLLFPPVSDLIISIVVPRLWVYLAQQYPDCGYIQHGSTQIVGIFSIVAPRLWVYLAWQHPDCGYIQHGSTQIVGIFSCLKTMRLMYVAFLLRMHHYDVRLITGWFLARKMCTTGATYVCTCGLFCNYIFCN